MNTDGYDTIKTLARDSGIPIPDLLALARSNDPFFAGSEAQVAKARWFGNVWGRFGYTGGVHLRRVHYQLVSTGVSLPDGSPYLNTERCWGFICEAGKLARYLGVVAPDAFEDRRNPPTQIAWIDRDLPFPSPRSEVDVYTFDLPTIQADLADDFRLYPPEPFVAGYEYVPADQPFLVEVYVEKSTMDDILAPLCRQYGVNLSTSLGFQSITSIIGLLRRARLARKPTRVLYISDFDPAGDAMPTAVARQIEYWRTRYAPMVEIKLEPVILTRDLVEQYDLPTIPIKESDLRADSFRLRRGVDGAVELDALEALHPGVLADVVGDAIRRYRDPDLERLLGETHREANDVARDTWNDLASDEIEELGRLEDAAGAILDTYRGRLQVLADELAAELAPTQDALRDLVERFRERVAEFRPDLPARPEPATDPDVEDEEEAWLYDSNRDYMEQLHQYKRRRRS